MKFRVIIKNSVGNFVCKIKEDKKNNIEKVTDVWNDTINDITSIVAELENGQHIIIGKEMIKNSVFLLEEVS